MEKLLTKIEKYILYTVLFLLPIAVASTSPNPFVVPKLALLFYGIALILLIKAAKVIITGRLDFSTGNFDLPVFLVALAFLLSAIFKTPNKMEAFLLPGTATVVLGGCLLYYLINQHKEEEKHKISLILFASGVVFSVLALLSFFQVLAKITLLPSYLKGQGFTPDGGYLPATLLLFVLLPIGVGLFLAKKDAVQKLLLGVCVGLTALALAVSIYNVLPGRSVSPRLPSYSDSWSIAVDSLKESPIFGIGAGNYLSAFNRYRPLSYNLTDLWAIKFATSRSFYLTALTEVGMLGAAGFILLLVSLYKLAGKDIRERKMVGWGFASASQMFSLTLIAVAFALIPATALLLTVFFIFLALNSKTKSSSLNFATQTSSKLPSLFVTLPVIIAVIILSYRAGIILVAEYQFTQSLNLLAKNDAAGTYDTMRQAIASNPLVDRYHIAFSQVNLALANTLASRAVNSQRQNTADVTQPTKLSDQDRANITLLIQQAISEGKAAVALNPSRSGNWEVLAQIYRSIMSLAQGSDKFAVQTLRQAVALDPINPNLRIALGGLYYSQKDYENAVNVFQLAASAKPDFANAHYNLAFAYRDRGQLDQAIAEMTLVMSLIKDKNSQDYTVAKNALADMQTSLSAQAGKKAQGETGQELSAPQSAQKSTVEPPIDLPQGSEPPAVSPTPTPIAVSPTPTPSQ